MRHVFCSFFLLIWLGGCVSSESESVQRSRSDTSAIKHDLVAVFNADEKNAMDSISKYGFEAIHRECLEFLYVIYGSEVLNDKNARTDLTIGECNIRLIDFSDRSNGVKSLTYAVFINDSIPTNVIINTSMGQMINGFDISIEKKKVIVATVGELGKIDIENVRELCNNARSSNLFNDYIDSHRAQLHPKFSKLLNM